MIQYVLCTFAASRGACCFLCVYVCVWACVCVCVCVLATSPPEAKMLEVVEHLATSKHLQPPSDVRPWLEGALGRLLA